MDFSFSQFIEEYFLGPINHPETYAPYNVVNTIVFAVVALAAVFLIYKFLNSRGVKTDACFYWLVIPFIFFGGIVRVLSDANVLPRAVEIMGIALYPFITPQVYVLIFLITFAALFLSRWLCGKEWQSVFSNAGWVLSALALLPLLLLFKNFLLFGGILAIVGLLLLALHFSPWRTSAVERGVVLSQCLDGAATFIGVQFGGYGEQHVVGNAVFNAFGGPWAFLVIKILFALVVVYVLRLEFEKTKCVEETAFVSLIITIFGLAPGMRDSLRLLAGV